MADRKPIRWAVPRGGESYMGLAAYFLAHEENMRQSFSQPSRRARRTLPDGTTIDYIMNDVVDFIQISPPQGLRRAVGKAMTWDKLPPLETGTTNIDLSQMTADPDVSGGYYCTVSVINGTDEMGRMLPAEFSVDTEDSGWSIEQIDGKSARLKLGVGVEDECDIVARDGKTELRKKLTIAGKTYCLLCSNGKFVRLDSNFRPTASQTGAATDFEPYYGTDVVQMAGTITTITSGYIVGPTMYALDGGITNCVISEGVYGKLWFTRYLWETHRQEIVNVVYDVLLDGNVIDSVTTNTDTGDVLWRTDTYGLGTVCATEATESACTSESPVLPFDVGTGTTSFVGIVESLFLSNSLYCYRTTEWKGSAFLIEIVTQPYEITMREGNYYINVNSEDHCYFVKSDDSIVTLDPTNNTIIVGGEAVTVYYDQMYWG